MKFVTKRTVVLYCDYMTTRAVPVVMAGKGKQPHPSWSNLFIFLFCKDDTHPTPSPNQTLARSLGLIVHGGRMCAHPEVPEDGHLPKGLVGLVEAAAAAAVVPVRTGFERATECFHAGREPGTP